MEATGTFGAWDYVILSIVLLCSAGIGVYYRFKDGKHKNTREFLLADRSMPILPVAFSLMTSFMSAVTLLGLSNEIYQYGTMFVIINLAYVVSTPVAVYLILPIFYRLKTASVYEYLGMRFGYATRLCASLAFSLQMIFYMGIVLYAPALALEAVTGLNLVLSVVLIGAVCTFYATIGGMKAVLITDIFQSLLMYVAVFSVIICALIKAGNFQNIWQAAVEGGRIEFLNFSIDPTTRHSWFTQIIGGSATYLALYGVNQVQVQRLLSVRNLKSSQASLWWNLPMLMLLSASTCFSGLCIYYYYRECDPGLAGRITSYDQIMPRFVVDNLGHIPGLAGLFVSGIFSASLSTISSVINSLAAVTLEDYLKPLLLRFSQTPLTDSRTVWFSKLLTIIYGGACIGLAFLAGSMGGVLQAALTIFGVVGGPLLALFSLGMFLTVSNQKGAITGLATGLAISFWLGFGKPKPPLQNLPLSIEGCPSTRATTHIIEIFSRATEETHYFYLYRISYMWYAVVGFLVTFIVGLLASCIYAQLKWDLNEKIYTDKQRTLIRYELFVPPLAKRLRLKQMPLVVVTGTSSELCASSTTASVHDENDTTNAEKIETDSTEDDKNKSTNGSLTLQNNEFAAKY